MDGDGGGVRMCAESVVVKEQAHDRHVAAYLATRLFEPHPGANCERW